MRLTQRQLLRRARAAYEAGRRTWALGRTLPVVLLGGVIIATMGAAASPQTAWCLLGASFLTAWMAAYVGRAFEPGVFAGAALGACAVCFGACRLQPSLTPMALAVGIGVGAGLTAPNGRDAWQYFLVLVLLSVLLSLLASHRLASLVYAGLMGLVALSVWLWRA